MGLFILACLIAIPIWAWQMSKNLPEDLLKDTPKNKPFVQVRDVSQAEKNMVARDNTPLFIRRGWKQSGNTYSGYYRTEFGAWNGSIERRGDKYKVYIYNPPRRQLKLHSRWVCLHKAEGNKWRVDLAKAPRDGDVGAIVFYVETLIKQSFKLWREEGHVI